MDGLAKPDYHSLFVGLYPSQLVPDMCGLSPSTSSSMGAIVDGQALPQCLWGFIHPRREYISSIPSGFLHVSSLFFFLKQCHPTKFLCWAVGLLWGPSIGTQNGRERYKSTSGTNGSPLGVAICPRVERYIKTRRLQRP